MKEIWKDVKGFEGLYMISNLGRIKHYSNKNKWKILKQTNKKGSYFKIVLKCKDYTKSTRIHRLVAEAFIPNPNNLPQVNHIDMNKQNNKVDNLEWVTPKENVCKAIQQKPYMIENMIKYNTITRPKRVCQYSLSGDLICVFNNAKEAQKSTNVCSRNILQVASKEPYNDKGDTRKQAGGYIWKFLDEEVM